MTLLKSDNPGRVIFGLRVAGLAGIKKAGPKMVKIVKYGMKLLKKDNNSGLSGLGSGDSGVMSVHDGTGERLRIAAAMAVLDLQDNTLKKSFRQAMQFWWRRREKNGLLDELQKDAKNAMLCALSVMGDGSASVRIINDLISNSRAMENMFDEINKPSWRKRTKEEEKRRRWIISQGIPNTKKRNRLIRKALVNTPASVWPVVAESLTAEWNGSHARDALMLVLAGKGGASLNRTEQDALKKIRKKTAISAIKIMARHLLAETR